MTALSDLLLDSNDTLVQAWCARWSEEGSDKTEMSRAALRDHLPIQLRVIGEQLAKISGGGARRPRRCGG